MRTNDELLALARAKASRIMRRRRLIGGVSAAVVIVLVAGTILTASRGDRVGTVGTTGATTAPSASSSVSEPSSTSDSIPLESDAPPATGESEEQEGLPPDVGVSADPPEPVSGDLVTFTVTLRNRYLYQWVTFALTEQQRPSLTRIEGQPPVDCRSTERAASVETVRFTQRLRSVGLHRHFIVLHDCRDTSPQPRPPDEFVPTEVFVSGPAAPTNGPESPTLSDPITFFPPDAPLTIWQNLQGGDPDGGLDHFTVDWGDGSPVESPPAEFRDPGETQHDCSPNAEYSGTSGYAQPEHTYAAPGSYVLTLTIVSVDCSGGTVQQTTFVRTITVPLPRETSSSSS